MAEVTDNTPRVSYEVLRCYCRSCQHQEWVEADRLAAGSALRCSECDSFYLMTWRQFRFTDNARFGTTTTSSEGKFRRRGVPERTVMMLTPESAAASLGRLTDGLALIVCAAHALRAIEDSGVDCAAESAALRQGIAAVHQAAAELGLDLISSVGDQGS
jgi:hypothetical protein